MLPFLALLFLFTIVTIATGANTLRQTDEAPHTIPPRTVESLDLEAYMGRWYIMYTSVIPLSAWLQGGVCVTADYFGLTAADGKKTYQFVHSFRMDTPTGTLEQGSGVMISDMPDTEPGKLRVVMSQSSTPIDEHLYWIVDVGEIDANGQYCWAIVSVPFRHSLFILARDVEAFKTTMAPTVLQRAEQLGFTQFYNRPQVVYQAPDCEYVAPPAQ